MLEIIPSPDFLIKLRNLIFSNNCLSDIQYVHRVQFLLEFSHKSMKILAIILARGGSKGIQQLAVRRPEGFAGGLAG